MNILVTGAAGFIGMHVSAALADRGDSVVGVDNLSNYYDVSLKRARLRKLKRQESFRFKLLDIGDAEGLSALFRVGRFDRVIHLAAQPGVRYSVSHPQAYGQANLVGFLNLLECCRHYRIGHLVYASTSSVYGGNEALPFSESDNVDHPVSLYAATKKSNELMAHTYSHLYDVPTSGLRFFTVYGPWGRPDMGIFQFTGSIMKGEPIRIFNMGQMLRDFTYVDDIVRSVVRVLDIPALGDSSYDSSRPDPATSKAPYRVLNIGNELPVPLLEFVSAIEDAVGRPAIKNFLPMQPGDVQVTHADMSRLTSLTQDFTPRTPVQTGVRRFVDWYRDFYCVE